MSFLRAAKLIGTALRGLGRFEDFQDSLGISRNLLSSRLKQMVEEGLLERAPIDGSRRHAYRPTKKCKELRKILLSLAEWGEAWRGDPDGPRISLHDKNSEASVSLEFCRQDTGQIIDNKAVVTKFRSSV